MRASHDELLDFLRSGSFRGVRIGDSSERVVAALGPAEESDQLGKALVLWSYDARRVQLALYHSQLVFIGVYFRTSERAFGIALDQPKKIIRRLETGGLSLTPEFSTRSGVHVLIDDERLDSFQLSSTATR